MDHSEVFFCSHWTAMDPWLPPRSSDVNAVECALINETVKNNSNPLIPPLTAAPDTFYCCGAEGSIRRRFHGILTGCSRRQMSPKGAGERLRDQFYVLINNLYLLYFSLRVSLSIWKASHTVCTEAWFEWEQSCNSWSTWSSWSWSSIFKNMILQRTIFRWSFVAHFLNLMMSMCVWLAVFIALNLNKLKWRHIRLFRAYKTEFTTGG